MADDETPEQQDDKHRQAEEDEREILRRLGGHVQVKLSEQRSAACPQSASQMQHCRLCRHSINAEEDGLSGMLATPGTDLVM